MYDCMNEEDGGRVLHQLLKMKKRPNALIITGDHVAAGLIIEAWKNGIRIPEDLAVIGFDDQPIGRTLGLTTIDNQLPEMGATAFRIIYDQIQNNDGQPVHRKLEYRIIERSSV